VLTVWEGFAKVLARAHSGFAVAALHFEQIDAEGEQRARHQAEQGARRARRASLDAQPRVRERGLTIWKTILEEADELDASAIVLGSRGLTGIRSLLLGSVTHAIVHHADRAVIIVPSREVAAERAKRRR
jgi:nucleotide-binding universal stress UspA family protein